MPAKKAITAAERRPEICHDKGSEGISGLKELSRPE